MTALILNIIVSFLGALILHELGHYVAARLCGVPIKEMGFGWGRRIYGFRVKSVECQIRIWPVGAYVQMDMVALQRRTLLQQLFVFGAGIAVNLILAALTWGTLFGGFNLALAIGNLIPFYQLDGWKGGMVMIRKLFGRPSPLVEWILTLGGGAITMAVVVRALLNF